MFTIGRRRGDAQVFCDIDYLPHIWGRFTPILSVTEAAYTHQTAVLLGPK